MTPPADPARELARQRYADAARAEAVARVAGRASHDVNNLVAVVKGYCFLLGPLAARDSEAADLVQAIEGASRDLAAVTARLQALGGGPGGRPRPVTLNDVARRATDEGRHLLPAGVEFAVELADAAGWVTADADRLGQAVLHLLVNAGEATPAGGRVELTTCRRAEGGRDWAVLAVADTGVGLTPEVRARLFTPLFTTRPGRGGAGAGLGVVREVADRAGGRVEVESAVGAGSRFSLVLPAVAPPPG